MTCHLSRVDESNDKQESGPSKSIKHWTNQSPGILFVPVAYCVACVQTHRLSPNVASFGMCALAHSTSVVLHTRRPLNSRMQATHPPSPNDGAIRGVHVLGSFVGCCRAGCFFPAKTAQHDAMLFLPFPRTVCVFSPTSDWMHHALFATRPRPAVAALHRATCLRRLGGWACQKLSRVHKECCRFEPLQWGLQAATTHCSLRHANSAVAASSFACLPGRSADSDLIFTLTNRRTGPMRAECGTGLHPCHGPAPAKPSPRPPTSLHPAAPPPGSRPPGRRC